MNVERVEEALRHVGRRVPQPLQELVERAGRHQTMTLAAGLAFLGLVSLGPALAVGMALLRGLTSPQTATAVVDALKATFPETLGLADLIGQMEGQVGRYAGLSLVVLLWPATSLASGWLRALDAISEEEATPALRGLVGRAKGLGLGLALLAGFVLVVATMVAGTAFAGRRAAALAGLLAVTPASLFVTCLALYRWFPSHRRRPWSLIWQGAAWATAGVFVATIGFALGLTLAEQLAGHYPPSLSTAIVVGLWLYGANACLLLGDEWNALRAR
ncbi:MAG TPA: YihY/virulence factor BrkB family protein [Egibacteraceae bacterium]|nr:YihY/virulence factor BrkB family protein [Actinomycetota bacterium]HWB72803.1 YihY/virulence factor BrkB family protein [Egibacteraceae bacterium]